MKKSDSFKEPFKSIDTAFVKLRTGKTLDPSEKKSLVNFIDDFTTVLVTIIVRAVVALNIGNMQKCLAHS